MELLPQLSRPSATMPAASVPQATSLASLHVQAASYLPSAGSFGAHRPDASNPDSLFASNVSKALAAALRHDHGHAPRIPVLPSGWARLQDMLNWPRVKAQGASPGDLLELTRTNEKSRYELGELNGTWYTRALQGHSRSDVTTDDLLEELSEKTLPERILHGTKWSLYDSIQESGLIPSGKLSRGGGGRNMEGRQHVHFISSEDRDKPGVSGIRSNATMLIEVDPAHASRRGVRFFVSKNKVILTPDVVPPESIVSYQSLKTLKKYDRRGNPM